MGENVCFQKRSRKVAKCIRCGKGGLFYKVTINGLCLDCERIMKIEAELENLQQKIEELKKKRLDEIAEYEKVKSNKEQLFKDIAAEAKEHALAEIDCQLSRKNEEIKKLESIIVEKQNILMDTENECQRLQKSTETNAKKLLKIQTSFKSLQYSIKRSFDEPETSRNILNETTDEVDELLTTTVKLKLNLMDVRELRKRYGINEKIIKEILVKYESRYTTKSNMAIYKLMVIALDAELQNILFNLKFSKLDKAIKDIKAMTSKYQKIGSDGNQLIAPTIKKFIGEIEFLL
jgi:chromosome segregation ATPase